MKYNTLLIILLIILTLILVGIFFWGVTCETVIKPIDLELSMINQNTLIAFCPANYVKPSILASLTPDDLLWKIVKCESNFDPLVCNQKYGCKAGMGLCQLIPSTVKYCEEKLGKKIDPFNPEDNLECGKWLLENEGDIHWREWSGYCYLK